MRRSWPYLLLLPALLIVALVVLLPLVFSLYSSFTAYRLTRPDSITRFIGFANYVRLFQDMDFWLAFGRTILFLTSVLNAELSLGLGLALLLEHVPRRQRLLRPLPMYLVLFSRILVR